MATKLPYVVPSTEWVKWNALKEKHKNIIYFYHLKINVYREKQMKIKDIELKHPKWFKGKQKGLCLSRLPQK